MGKLTALAAITLTFSSVTPAQAERFLPDARIKHDGVSFYIRMNDKYDYFEIVNSSIFGTKESQAVASTAASKFLQPTNCSIAGFHKQIIDKKAYAWHAYYKCPEEFDLRQTVIDQRKSLFKFSPIAVD